MEGHMNQKPDPTRTPEIVARELLNVSVYDNRCRSGDVVEFDKLIEMSEIGDWKLSRFETARAYAEAQGWLVVEGNSLRLTTAGLAAA
jgi:hypothetical protein